MTHRARIAADRLLGTPAALVFNGMARVLGAILRRNHDISSSPVNRIIVAKLIGMGSIIQATPLLRALRKNYPDAKIAFLTMRSNAELVNRLEYVDEIVTLDDRSILSMAVSTLKAVLTMIRMRATVYFDLEVYSAFASLLALWAMTRHRIGFYRHSVAFKHGIYTHLVFFNTRMPVRQLYLQLARVAGVPPGPSDEIGTLRVDDDDRAGVARILSRFPGWQVGKPYVLVNPNASDLLLERRWPAENFTETVQRLVANGQQLAFIGVGNEHSYVESICAQLSLETRSSVANTAGLLSVGELLALMEGATCVLTNDTGPMHMAIALRRPTVCLFGPANPEHYGPSAPNVEIFYNQVFCSPCLYEADRPPCAGKNICMQRIKPRPVADTVLRLIKEEFALRAAVPAPDVKPAPSRRRHRLSNQSVLADTPDHSPLGVVVRGLFERKSA